MKFQKKTYGIGICMFIMYAIILYTNHNVSNYMKTYLITSGDSIIQHYRLMSFIATIGVSFTGIITWFFVIPDEIEEKHDEFI